VTVQQPFIDLKKAYDSFRIEVLNSVLTESGIPMKLIRIIEILK
jgi:hypothetical protein